MGKARKKKHPSAMIPGRAGVPGRDGAGAVPFTMVIQRGKVGRLVNSLVMDIRKVMEPYTAQKLKVLKNNVLKDFLHVAGPYGVTHLLLLSKSEVSANLRICRLPRGPTITFHVLSFSLCKDVVSSVKHATFGQQLFTDPPLLVLSNFNTELSSMKLLTTTLQNMFSSINIQTVKLSTIKRCVLFHHDRDTNTILFRHYAIKVLPVGTSRSVKKLLKKQNVPDLSKYEDISDFITKECMSESEAEDGAGDEEVTLPQDLPGAGNIKQQQSAIKLTELGPRMTLQLIKIEDSVCDGEVLHHEFITKAKKDILETKKRHQLRRKLKEQRKKEQEINVKRKQEEKNEHRVRSIAGQKRKHEGSEAKPDEATTDATNKKNKKAFNRTHRMSANNTSTAKARIKHKKTFSNKRKRHNRLEF